jgi:IS5 family transposase
LIYKVKSKTTELKMRIKINPQLSLFDNFAKHQLGKELCAISKLLDEYPELYELAAKDLVRVDTNKRGRKGLTVESVVRCALLKQHRQLSYEELAFYLEDSQSFQAFARLDGKVPKKSALQAVITLIKSETWERINRKLLEIALLKKLENGKKIRIDSTVTESDIHKPSDNSLLYDGVRIICRLLETAEGFQQINYCNRSRRAKKLSCLIRTVKEKRRYKCYRELIKITKEELYYLQQVKQNLLSAGIINMLIEAWLASVNHYIPLIEKVISQAERRILYGEKLPASEKLVSLFEEHTDIIAKANRVIKFGHKLNIVTGKSCMILDAVIEQGNPSDSKRLIPLLGRQKDIYNCLPEQASADGAYASKDNLSDAKTLGVQDMAFHKKRGLKIEDMVKSKWVYRQLRNFRAGIESNISCLKRAYGLKRCLWKGWEKFKSYIWSAIVAYNLSLLAKFLPHPG